MKYYKYTLLALTLIFISSLMLKWQDIGGVSVIRGYGMTLIPVVIIALLVIISGIFSKPIGGIRIIISSAVLIMAELTDHALRLVYLDSPDLTYYLKYLCPGAWISLASALLLIICGIWYSYKLRRNSNCN